MKIVFACGGTAGHINPAIAVADALKKNDSATEILFIGNPNRMEADLVPKAGYAFEPLLVEGFHRSLKPKSMIHNFLSVFYLLTASKKVKKILEDFSPSVVMGTGGYVSGPVLRTAAKMNIKTITHESNAYPGVTTKILTTYVDKILLASEDAKKHLPENDNYVITGNPVRPEILSANREKAREKLGVGQAICVLSYGGSNGAEKINTAMAEVIAKSLPNGKIHHIHATGRFGVKSFPARLKALGVDLENDKLDIREYISDMADCLAAADLVICRAGAMAISELEATGKASILIPSPNVAENHQYHNAMSLVNHNAALLVEETNLTGGSLYQLIEDLTEEPQELKNIGYNASMLAVDNSAELICNEIYELEAKSF